MVERSSNVKARVIEKINTKTIEKATMNNIAIGSTVLSDEWTVYRVLQSFYNVLFKRGVFGVYHSISEKHTERYLNEYIFRYIYLKNHKIGYMFNNILVNVKKYLVNSYEN